MGVVDGMANTSKSSKKKSETTRRKAKSSKRSTAKKSVKKSNKPKPRKPAGKSSKRSTVDKSGVESNGQGSGDRAKWVRADQSIDEHLAAMALYQMHLGRTPSPVELQAYKRHAGHIEETLRRHHLQTVPKGDYVKMSGRQQKVIDTQAVRWGMPVAGPTVNIYQLVLWLHEWFGENGRAVARVSDPKPDKPESEIEALKVERMRFDLERARGDWVPREDVLEGFAVIAEHVRRGIETLQKTFGPSAHETMVESLDAAMREVAKRFEKEQ